MKGSSIRIAAAFVIVAFLSITNARAQYIAGNTFNPYTLYGLGEMNVTGDAAALSMGGIGIAARDQLTPNSINPAAYSSMTEKSVLFAIGIKGNNNYLKEGALMSSHNAVLLNNVNFQFRIAKGIGFGMSLNPYSSVGYRIKVQETDPEIISSIGNVSYRYSGNGGVSELKAGFGFAILNNFSIGINYVYYLGQIERNFYTDITPSIPPADYRIDYDIRMLQVNNSSFEIGLQYHKNISDDKQINVGLIYQPGFKYDNWVKHEITTYDGSAVDTVKFDNYKTKLHLPSKYGGGVMYQSSKIKLGVDYMYLDYKNLFGGNYHTNTDVTFSSSHDARVGFEITPNRYDIRKFLNRWSYRVGVRYNRSYMNYNNKALDDAALSLGLGIPIQGSSSVAYANIGAEIGRMGFGQGQLSNTYLRFFIGFNFFSKNEWFRQHRFR